MNLRFSCYFWATEARLVPNIFFFFQRNSILWLPCDSQWHRNQFPVYIGLLLHPPNQTGVGCERQWRLHFQHKKKRLDEVCDCTWALESAWAYIEGRLECHGAELTQSSFRPRESETTWHLSDSNQGRIPNPFTIWGKDEPWLHQWRSTPCCTAPEGMTGF